MLRRQTPMIFARGKRTQGPCWVVRLCSEFCTPPAARHPYLHGSQHAAQAVAGICMRMLQCGAALHAVSGVAG